MEKYLVYAKYITGYDTVKEYVWVGLERFNTGDMVVVDSRNGLGICQVTKCDSWQDDSKASKYIVGKVDNAKYENRKKLDELEKELEKKLKARAKKLQSIALYEMLAKDDPEMQELVDRYKQVAAQ